MMSAAKNTEKPITTTKDQHAVSRMVADKMKKHKGPVALGKTTKKTSGKRPPARTTPRKAATRSLKMDLADSVLLAGITSVAQAARTLVLAGKTNEQVLDALIAKFPGFDVAKKKHYPAWYRAELKRKGEKVPAVKQ